MSWLDFIMLLIKFGPTIIQIIREILDLIKMQPIELQAAYQSELKMAIKVMRQDKMRGVNALESLRNKLKSA